MAGSATLATDKFRFATAATRISESRTSGALSGARPVAAGGAVVVVAGVMLPSAADDSRQRASPGDITATGTTGPRIVQLAGLRLALGAVALFSILGLWFTRRLPAHAGAAAAEVTPAVAAGPA